ncbi:MAG: acyl-CoA synthetase [Proteobacteria bacterium]|nr:acyl-CoA synthetase [Pseudomonadota bacterium]
MLPLIGHVRAEATLAYRGGAAISAARFLADVAELGDRLGDSRHVLNACDDRYRFAVGLAACAATGRVSLLPPTHTRDLIRQLRASFPDAVCLTDQAACTIGLPHLHYPDTSARPVAKHFSVPKVPATQLLAYVFTSGSTGAPQPWRKRFGPLVTCVREESRRLGLEGTAAAIVATVPPQHMYGLESSVLMPLAAGHALCAERPFYPADIAAALDLVPRPRVLVSTPVHLRALLGSGVPLPEVDLMVSATAPLPQPLAVEIEERFATRLIDLYGSTETGQIATRRLSEGLEWQLWPGVRLGHRDGDTWADGGHIEQPTRLCDVIEVTGPESFRLQGRQADLVNIAGKRSSLAYLNHQLASIPGVHDGAFFHVEERRGSHTGVARVAACVVAPRLDAAALMELLRERIDPVFLPRPLVFVARLPRNSTGKLPQEALMALAAAHLKSSVA